MEFNKEDKKAFVDALAGNVTRRIASLIDNDFIPEEWDGIELRWLLADSFADQAPIPERYSRRKRAYRNTVLVNNLL